MERGSGECENCGMIFDDQPSLARHQAKFCRNSKYGNSAVFSKEYDTIAQGRDLSILGKNHSTSLAPTLSRAKAYEEGVEGDIEKEYRMLLREIGGREDLKNKLERQRRQAEQQLSLLQVKEKQASVEAKRKDLVDVIKRRQQLAREQQTLEKELKIYDRQRKEQQKNRNSKPDEDFLYRQGRQAGKLAMQRHLLEEKKRDLEYNLKMKKREEERVHRELGNIAQTPIYIPDFKAIPKPVSKQPQPRPIEQSSPPPQQIPSKMQSKIKQSYPSPKMPEKNQRNERLNILQPQSIIKPVIMPAENPLMGSMSKKSNVSYASQPDPTLFKPEHFAGKEKTLFESLNPKGKSDEDIFLQSLVAQQYDALNMLARIPKQSQLYQIKLKQYQEMSRIRQQLRDKVQLTRLNKVKRQFELQKQMTETEKANIKWLDHNRKQMLNKGMNIISKQQRNGPEDLPAEASGNYNNQPFKNSPNQFFNTSNSNNNNPLNSFNNLPASGQRLQSAQSGLKGYRATIKQIRNYEGNGPCCVKAIILEDGDAKPRGIYTTKYHDGLASKDERNPYNPGTRNRRDQQGNLIFNQSLELREDLQGRYNSQQAEIYLWLMLMEKDEQKLTNQPSIYAWYCFKLTHFGQIRQGTFTLTLYQQNFPFPEPADMNRLKARAQQEIVIELSQMILTSNPAPKPAPQPEPQSQQTALNNTNLAKNSRGNTNVVSQRTRTNGSRRKHSMKIQNNVPQDSVKNIKQPFFKQNEDESDFIPINKGSKVVMSASVVGMRTAPSHIGPLKVQIKLFDHRKKQLISKQQGIGSLHGDMYNPNIGVSAVINNQVLPASASLLIRITGLNTLNYQPGLVGFSYFHLFYNENGEQIEDQDQNKFYMILGNFQIPVYWGQAETYIPKQVLQLYPKIPCTSLLISINNTEEPEFPSYEQGGYNTTFFPVSQIQYRLFGEQAKREPLEIQEYVSAYARFKGIKQQGKGVEKLLSQALALKEENIKNLQLLSSMAEYNPTFGIVVSVDMISVPSSKTNYYYFCSLCLSPPAAYYTKDVPDLVFFYRADLATSLTNDFILSDDLLSLSPQYSPNAAIIMELHRVELNQNGTPKPNVQTCGNAILPIFSPQAQIVCVAVGGYELKLDPDDFDRKEIKNVQRQLRDYLQDTKGRKKSEYSILLRIMNGFFPNQLQGPRAGQRGKPLRSVFQNSKGFKNTQEAVKKIIESNFGVKNI